jgi:membrane glycosyltransferase
MRAREALRLSPDAAPVEQPGYLPHAPPLPTQSPLGMPVQALDAPRSAAASPPTQPRRIGLRRVLVFGLALVFAGVLGAQMYLVLIVGGLTLLEGAILALFVALNAWLSISLAGTMVGLFLPDRTGLSGIEIDDAGPLPVLTTRSAILMPVYNELPGAAFAKLQATCESLAETDRIAEFDIFVLSDTTDADIWIAEEAGFLGLRERLGGIVDAKQLFYRRRPKNTDRKAGNIAEWVLRFGGVYECMIVLDADSIMSGDTLVRLVGAMERYPCVGLIQTLPRIVNAGSVYGRVQQFASHLYGPAIARGIAFWHGADSNFWGHNAALRVRAFAAEAGLPHLKGVKPFGGHILSHDFVEAALMRRGGWAVHLVPHLGGSFEEAPPSIPDVAVRDRRWCQGNLQHAKVILARGLAPVSRLHFLFGITSYLAAPLLVLMIAIGLGAAAQARFVPPNYFPEGFALFPSWPAQDPVRALWVLGASMTLLLAPKVFAFLAALTNTALRHGFNGWRLVPGFIVELVIATLVAPLALIDQTKAVVTILAGRDSGWAPQRRDDGKIPWREAARGYLAHTLTGLAVAGIAYAISWPVFLWMSPLFIGLILAVPLVRWTASAHLGRALAQAGLLATPAETQRPPVLTRAEALRRGGGEASPGEALDRLAANAALRDWHRRGLEAQGDRPRGDYDPVPLIAAAKVADARTRTEALALLNAREKAAALAETETFDRLMALPAH